jgi:multiple sugar transport system substrate-binding protein
MHSSKKIATIVGVLTLSALALAGCGNAGGSGSGSATLSMSIWDSNQLPAMQAMADKFTEENPDITVNIEVTPWDQYWTNLNAGAQGGAMPDVFWMHPENISNFATNGALLDLTDRIAEDNFDMSVFPEGIVASHVVDGRNFAMPKDVSTMGLFFNKDIFDAAGVAYPDDTWTWDTWMEVAGKLTNADDGIFGMLAPNNGQNFTYNLVYQNGGDFFDADGKSLWGSPEAIGAVEFGLQFIENGYSPTLADFANTTEEQFFETGRAAMLTSGSWMLDYFTSIEGLNVDIAPMPKGVQRGSIAASMGYSIASHTSHPDEAWKFLQFMGGKEANTIQAEMGAAISVYEGTGDLFAARFPDVNAQVFVDAMEYGSGSYMQEPSRPLWVTEEQDTLREIWAGTANPQTVLPQLAERINTVIEQHSN